MTVVHRQSDDTDRFTTLGASGGRPDTYGRRTEDSAVTAAGWRLPVVVSRLGTTLVTHRHAAWRLAFCAALFVVVMVQVWTNAGVLIHADHVGHELGLVDRVPWLEPIALALDHIGQREPIGGLMLGCAATLAWYRHTWRPITLCVVAILSVNLIVGTLKLTTGRVKPFFDKTALFEGGMIFPSGHTANVVLTWGLLFYLLIAYGGARRKRAAVWTTVGLSLSMGMITFFLDTHWITDIIAGWIIGGILLELLVLYDTVRPPITKDLASRYLMRQQGAIGNRSSPARDIERRAPSERAA